MTLIDFSNARRFYSSMGKPSAVKGRDKTCVPHYKSVCKTSSLLDLSEVQLELRFSKSWEQELL